MHEQRKAKIFHVMCEYSLTNPLLCRGGGVKNDYFHPRFGAKLQVCKNDFQHCYFSLTQRLVNP